MAESEEPQVTLDTIHVNNLDWNIDEEKLAEIFSEFGGVESSKIPRRHGKGGSKGFGFVTFDSEASARNAIEQMNNVPVDGRRIGVVFATSAETEEKKPKAESRAAEEAAEKPRAEALAAEEEPDPCARLHVRQLAWALTSEDLEEAFTPYGEVLNCRVITNRRSKRSKGYGFLEYATVEEATAAKEAMNNVRLEGREIKVFYSKSTGPKEPQQMQEDNLADNEEGAAPRAAKKRSRKKRTKNARQAEEPAPVEEGDAKPKPTKKPKAKKRLYVKCPPAFDEEKIRALFEPYGAVKKVNISMDNEEPPQPKGVVFVSFESTESAENALEKNGAEIDEEIIEVSWAQNFSRRRPARQRA